MKRRRAIEVWPAFADLMTILSVPGLFLALGLLAVMGNDLNPIQRVQALEAKNKELEAELQEALEVLQQAAGPGENAEELRRELRERARNKAMFRAIQEVQLLIDSLASQTDLHFSEDQTLQFGDDLVSFDLNGVQAKWTNQGQDRLRPFCEALEREMVGRSTGPGDLTRFFAIEVEGHTDSTICSFNPNCNWSFSSARAIAFMSLMRDEAICPGGSNLELRPVGLADTKPQIIPGSSVKVATRRIAVRIVPNYQAIIEASSRAVPQEPGHRL